MSKRQPRKVTLYFNEDDELVDEEEALSDCHNKYHSVVVDYGNER